MATTYKRYSTGEKTDSYSKITNAIVAKLQQNIAEGNFEMPWVKPWNSCSPMSIHGHKYRGMNQFLLTFLGRNKEGIPFSDPRYITFDQAKKMGGNVKAGEHGFPVIYWQWIEVEDKDTKLKKSVPFCKGYTVFNVEQTENCNIPELKTDKLDFVPSEKAEEIISSWANKPKVVFGGNRACYNWKIDTVTLPPVENFKSIEDYYSTEWHEFGHATGHPARLDRKTNLEFTTRTENYSKEELVAQMFSAFMMSECGMNIPAQMDNTAAYVQSWISTFKDDPKMLITAAGLAQKAADYVLGRSYEKLEEAA